MGSLYTRDMILRDEGYSSAQGRGGNSAYEAYLAAHPQAGGQSAADWLLQANQGFINSTDPGIKQAASILGATPDLSGQALAGASASLRARSGFGSESTFLGAGPVAIDSTLLGAQGLSLTPGVVPPGNPNAPGSGRGAGYGRGGSAPRPGTDGDPTSPLNGGDVTQYPPRRPRFAPEPGAGTILGGGMP